MWRPSSSSTRATGLRSVPLGRERRRRYRRMVADPFAALSAAITMAGTGIATAWAEKVVGGATVGAMAEKPELFGRGPILMVLPIPSVAFAPGIRLQLFTKAQKPVSTGRQTGNADGPPRSS